MKFWRICQISTETVDMILEFQESPPTSRTIPGNTADIPVLPSDNTNIPVTPLDVLYMPVTPSTFTNIPVTTDITYTSAILEDVTHTNHCIWGYHTCTKHIRGGYRIFWLGGCCYETFYFIHFRKPLKLNFNSRNKNVKYEMINMMVVLFNSLEELIDFTKRW